MLQFARIFTIVLATQLPLLANLPELSSIEPIEYDEASQRLIARGDAQLLYGDSSLKADSILYYQETNTVDALGQVSINTDGTRFIAEELSFNIDRETLDFNNFKTGQWPFYITGETAGGDSSLASADNTTLYYGNPGKFSPNLKAQKITYNERETRQVTFEKTTFHIGDIPVFYLPQYTRNLDEPPYFLDLSAGYDGNIGAYLQSTILFPTTSWLRAGANFDIYTKSGALIGPAAQYTYDNANNRIIGAISTGYIHDNSDTGLDVHERIISEDRGFAVWRHKHKIGQRISTTANISYWSDSEVMRDYRDDYFQDDRRPDSFLEADYLGDNFILSVFARVNPNDFDLIQERLPEVRLDVLPTPILQTGAYHRASVSYARLSEDFDDIDSTFDETSTYDRFDLNYRLERPLALTNWLTFTPLAGARFTQYQNQEADSAFFPINDDNYSRDLYEIGFDLEARAYAVYPTVNRTWGIDGLRHLVHPIVRYRYISDPGTEAGDILTIDRRAFDLNRPILDLSDQNYVDQIQETNRLRVGVENLFQTRAANGNYGSRALGALNFYQDILFEKGARYDDPTEEQDTFNATWIELLVSPAPWLRFDMTSRIRTENLTLEELRTRTALISGEIWEIGLSTDLLNKKVDQYRLDFLYRLNERYTLLTDVRLDADSGRLTKTRLGIRTRIGSAWELLYALTFREGADRESDFQFTINLRLMDL